LPFLKGDVAEGLRKEVFYFADASDLNAVRSFKTAKGNLFTGTRNQPAFLPSPTLRQIETNNF
jgi:hypothetical protein